MTAIDWPGLMRAGMAGLGLTPDAFWRLTPVELRMMLGAEAGAAPLTRARLSELAAAYPDVTKGQGDGGNRNAGRPVGGAGGNLGGNRRDGGQF